MNTTLSIPEQVIVKSDELTVIMVASFFTIYLQDCHEHGLRQRISKIIEKYLMRWGDHIVWSKHPKSARWYRIGSKRLPEFGKWFDELDPDLPWEFNLHGGDKPESASSYLIQGYGRSKWQGGFGYLRMVLPAEFSLNSPDAFVRYVVDVCEFLKPWHGYGGLGFIESSEIDVKQKFESQVTLLAEKFFGVEVDVPIVHLNQLRNAIKGVSWLTILDNYWLDHLPLLEVLKQEEPAIEFSHYSNWSMLRAGARPVYGDSKLDPIPSYYFRLARFLKTIRVKEHTSFHIAGEQPRMNDENSQHWLSRFDSSMDR